jgi:predicted amidohydrolase
MIGGRSNRRDFLKGAGAMGASTALVGCSAALAEDSQTSIRTSASDEDGRTLRAIALAKKAESDFHIFERVFSDDDELPSIGLANIHAVVPDIEANKEKIIRALRIFKKRHVNVAVFPEFCLTGYFWEDERACRSYMDKGVIENHLGWIEDSVKPLLDEYLGGVILNNLRKGPNNKYYNATFIITKSHDPMTEADIYHKVFLPGIEKIYTNTGRDDRLVVDTPWGRFGFTTCYDYLFSELIQEYTKIDKVDAIIQLASWRGSARRDYPGMNVGTDTYYGDLWNMVMPSTSAKNQIWTIACNAVGVHDVSGARFWGGSGLWAPSGLKLLQGSNLEEELLIVHNVDIRGQRKIELDDFNYAVDFEEIYRQIEGKRIFTRIKE